MNPKLKSLLTLLASLIASVFSGVQLGRLNVPETTAGVGDYLGYVGIPGAAGLGAAAMLFRSLFTGAAVQPPAVTGEPWREAIADAANKAVLCGRADVAVDILKPLIDADRGTMKPVAAAEAKLVNPPSVLSNPKGTG